MIGSPFNFLACVNGSPVTSRCTGLRHAGGGDGQTAAGALPGQGGGARAQDKDLEEGPGAGHVRAQQHYNPSRDVVARMEFIPETQFKVCPGLRAQGLHLGA